MTTIYIVRHGQSEGNANNNIQEQYAEKYGDAGAPLTLKGKDEVEKLKKIFKDINFDVIYSSDMARAVQTAEIIAQEKNLQVITSKVLRERSLGSLRKTINDEIRKEIIEILSKLSEMEKRDYHYVDDMETMNEVVTRYMRALREISLAYPNKTVLIASHGNVMRSLLTHLGYANYNELPGGSIVNTGYIVLESNGKDFLIKETHGIHKQQNAYRIL